MPEDVIESLEEQGSEPAHGLDYKNVLRAEANEPNEATFYFDVKKIASLPMIMGRAHHPAETLVDGMDASGNKCDLIKTMLKALSAQARTVSRRSSPAVDRLRARQRLLGKGCHGQSGPVALRRDPLRHYATRPSGSRASRPAISIIGRRSARRTGPGPTTSPRRRNGFIERQEAPVERSEPMECFVSI